MIKMMVLDFFKENRKGNIIKTVPLRAIRTAKSIRDVPDMRNIINISSNEIIYTQCVGIKAIIRGYCPEYVARHDIQ